MKAIILCAGKGSRMKPYTINLPKPMLPINDKPLLEHQLELLKKHNIYEVIINLHHCPDVIPSYFKNGNDWGMKINYSYERDLLGTAGAIKKAEKYLDETFIVLYGDVFTDADFTGMIKAHYHKNSIGTLGICYHPSPCDKGQILLGDKNRIIKFKEKPGKFLSHFINAGVYILEPRILEYIPQGMYYDFGKDLFPIIIQSEKLYAYEITEPLIDIGTPEIYKNFERYKTNRLEG